MFRILLRTIVFLIVVAVTLIAVMKVRYGGATVAFPDRSTEPMLPSSALEVVATLDEAPGNIAVSKSGRVFVTFQPEGNPAIKVAELVNGKPVPFPDAEFQRSRGWGQPYFNTPVSVRIDEQGRLWTLDAGFGVLGTPRILAFDLESRKLVHQWDIPSESAGVGSRIEDFQISVDGAFVFITDSSSGALRPALIVYEIKKQEGRRVLEEDPATVAGAYQILAGGRELTSWGGLYKIHPGLRSVVVDHHDVWVYFGPTSNEKMSRVRTADLRLASRANISYYAEEFGPKPQSAGLTMDAEGSIYVTDVEHSSVDVLSADRKLRTLIRDDKRIRWLEGLSLTEDGWLYMTDSALPDLMAGKPGAGPFFVYRTQVGKKGRAGN